MDVLVAVNLVVILAIAQQLYRRQNVLRQFFWPALTAKVIAGISLGLVYTYYYPVSDTFVYFSDASHLVSLARNDFLLYVKFLAADGPGAMPLALPQPRALFLTKITSVVALLTGNNYWTVNLYFSFVSFLSSWYLVRTLVRYFPTGASAAVVAFLFLPSAVFWTSGLLKESLAIAALFFLCQLMLKVWFSDRVGLHHLLAGLISLWILWNLKYFYAGVFLPIAVASLVYRKFVQEKYSMSAGLGFAIWLLILIIPLVVMSFLHPNFHLDRFASVVVENNAAYVLQSDPGDFVRFYNLTATVPGILSNAPLAIFSGLFRPLLWEANSITQVVAALENILLLMLFIGTLMRVRSFSLDQHRLLIFALILYIILLSLFITISAPNFGTLSRYRVGYISFFAFLLFYNNPLAEPIERTIARLARK